MPEGALTFTVCDSYRYFVQGGPKSKPLSRIIIKSYETPPLRLDFSSILTTKGAQNIISQR